MVHQRNLQTPYHQQDTSYFCGAACAQMVLDSIGSGLLDQTALYNDNHSHSTIESGWYTAPDGLEWTLNNRRPVGFNGVFVAFALSSEDAISRKIAWSIEHYGVAPCALVYGSQHWIVVRGMQLSQVPVSSDDTSYTIDYFQVNNPWPPVPSTPPPPPHSTNDGCGTGGNRGIANELVTYADWQNTYMTGVLSGHWNGTFIAVCDPDPPPIRRGISRPRERLRDGSRLIAAQDVVELAWIGLDRLRLEKDEVWERIKRDRKVGRPLLVQRLDRLDEYYYIVSLGADHEGAAAALTVDGRFGDLQRAVTFERPEKTLVEAADSSIVLRKVIGREFELEHEAGYVILREEATFVPELWFWKPCRESLSPLWPFKMIVSGGVTLYYRIDGQVFTALHEDVRGI